MLKIQLEHHRNKACTASILITLVNRIHHVKDSHYNQRMFFSTYQILKKIEGSFQIFSIFFTHIKTRPSFKHSTPI